MISAEDAARCGLAECVDALDANGFDVDDEDSLQHAALWLRRLGNDRDFLGDLLLEELKGRGGKDIPESAYSPQAIVLTGMRRGYFLRANIWPAERDHAFRASGAAAFAYGVPHDHNFSFLTLGYFGPGYRSDYWEYDYETVAGYPGEKAGLRFVERSALDPGKVMLYRAHRDVHSQLPPKSLSVSLNVMAAVPAQGWLDQYCFDPASNTIAGMISPNSTEAFLRIAVALGGEEALDLAERFGRSHPSDRLRLACFEARTARLDPGAADALWKEAEKAGSRLLAAEAGRRRALLCEQQPAEPDRERDQGDCPQYHDHASQPFGQAVEEPMDGGFEHAAYHDVGDIAQRHG